MADTVRDTTIVITGASSGLGLGAARELADRGARLVLAARRGDLLEDQAERLRAEGAQAIAVRTDVSDLGQIELLAQRAMDEFGRIHTWINNVGVGALGYFWEVPPEDHARTIDVNLTGLLYGCHVALRHFIRHGAGTVVNVGSVESELPVALQSSYAASKAAVYSLGRTINDELRLAGHDRAIKVATVMPWAVDTPWWTHAANYTGHAPRMAQMESPDASVAAIVRACTEPREAIPVGMRAHAATAMHHVFPGLTERLTAGVSRREADKGAMTPPTRGALYEPMAAGVTVEGGVRERMRREDEARA